MQNLSVGRRSINDLEEWAEVELSTVSGALKATATAGVIGLERLGNPTINTVLLAQNLSFTTPGQKAAVGGVVGLGVQYRPMPNAKLFVAGEGTAMSGQKRQLGRHRRRAGFRSNHCPDCFVAGAPRNDERKTDERSNIRRHGRACPGHPRLFCSKVKSKTWMPGTGLGMTFLSLLLVPAPATSRPLP